MTGWDGMYARARACAAASDGPKLIRLGRRRVGGRTGFVGSSGWRRAQRLALAQLDQ